MSRTTTHTTAPSTGKTGLVLPASSAITKDGGPQQRRDWVQPLTQDGAENGATSRRLRPTASKIITPSLTRSSSGAAKKHTSPAIPLDLLGVVVLAAVVGLAGGVPAIY